MAEAAGIRPILGAQLVAEGMKLWSSRRMSGVGAPFVGWSVRSTGRKSRKGSQAHLSPTIPSFPPFPTDQNRRHYPRHPAGDTGSPLGNRRAVCGTPPGKERHAVPGSGESVSIPPVVTNAVMFANPEDWSRHRLLTAIAANTTLSTCPPDRLSAGGVAGGQQSCDATSRRARSARAHGRAGRPLPLSHSDRERIVTPRLSETSDALQRLRALAYAGAERRYGRVAPVTRDRLEHELRSSLTRASPTISWW